MPGIKILFVEDDPADLELTQRALKKSGFKFSPLAVQTREAFINALNIFKPDVVLADHSLPGFDSSEALSIVLKQEDHPVFILVTGSISDEYAASIIKRGADDYLLKSHLSRLPLAIEKGLAYKQRRAELIRAEQELNEKNHLLSMLLDSVPVMYYLLDADSNAVVQLYGNIKEITGYDATLFFRHEFWLTILHPDDMPQVMEKWQELSTKHKVNREYRLQTVDLSYRWFYDTIKLIELGGKKYISGVVIDITHRKQSEIELIKNNEKWHALIENSSDTITLTDKEGTILYASPSSVGLFGYSLEDMVGKNIFEFISPDAISNALVTFESLLATPGAVTIIELDILHQDGRSFTMEIKSTNLLHNPDVNAIVINARDVTERKQAERELSREKKFLKTVLENINAGVVACDKDGEIVLFNKVALSIHQLAGKDIKPGKWTDNFDLYHNGTDLISPDQSPLLRVMRGEKIRNEEYYLVAKNTHSDLYVMISGQPLVSSRGETMGGVLVMHDISELKLTERKLLTKVKDLDTFIYRTSHDLKGPLVSVQGLLNISKGKVTDEFSLQVLGMIEASNTQLSNILSSLTEVTHVLNSEPVIETIDLKELIDAITDRIPMPGMRCAIRINDQVSVQSDRTLLDAILYQIVNNSVKYRKDGHLGCYMKIMVEAKESGTSISIEDNGRGIPPELQKKVFDMFFRGDDVVPGTGLGLFIVRSAIEKLGGSVKLLSEPGKGTTVTIVLPNP
jgi:PAS domain S-box-containing protein